MEEKITFYEKEHKYYLDDRYRLYSVNEVLKWFSNGFNPDEVINKYYNRWQNDSSNKYYGMSKEEIKSYWEQQCKDACDYGSLVHKEIENLFIDSKEGEFNHYYDYWNVTPEVETFKKWFSGVWEDGWRLYGSEVILYDKNIKVAGTVDFVLQRGEEFMLIDFKTNPNNKLLKKGYNKMLEPLNYLDDDTLTKYYLQLNFYNYLLNKSCNSKKTILNLNGDECWTYEAPNMSQSINEIVKYLNI